AATTAEVDVSVAVGAGDSDSPVGTAVRPLPGQTSLFDGLGEEYDAYRSEDDAPAPTLTFRETEGRLAVAAPEPKGRVEGAPQVVFPRRESRLSYAAFSLSDIPDGDAQAAGARFIK